MNHKYVLWLLLLAFAALALKEGFLRAIGPTLVLATVTYGGFFLMRWLLFRLGGVGKNDGGVDDDYLKWVKKNRPKPPK